jgi:hypothetical protein
MSTYREAILHARSGGTAYSRTRVVRFLTREEAEPIILEVIPSRRTVIDTDGKALIENGEIVVEEYADPHYRLAAFGLFDVSGAEPVQFQPTSEDIASEWRTTPEEIAPEPVAPEAVDEVLHEEVL